MDTEKLQDDAIQELLIVENPRALRLIFSEKHNVILKQITKDERSISEIARALKLNPGSVHYYLKELEKQGLARQVRQEIKGGIVKKYYRAAARRIVLASPDFGDQVFGRQNSGDEFGEWLVRSIERLGYQVPDADRDEAKELLLRYDRLIKELLKELQSGTHDVKDTGGAAPNPAYHLMIHFRALEDPELVRIYNQFHKLFRKVE